jgi:2-polyprenyl-3-methyl-5-hydroxy-6-metoxy-1,4-benzoquinol methylase
MFFYMTLMLLFQAVSTESFTVLPRSSSLAVLPSLTTPTIYYTVGGKPMTSTHFQEGGEGSRSSPPFRRQKLPQKIALDILCGIGDSTVELERRLSPSEWRVVGMDDDPIKVFIAQKKYPMLDFITCHMEDLPTARYDRIQIHSGRMLRIPNKCQFAREVVRILKPGGTVELFDFSLSHAFIHEIMDAQASAKQQYFKGWETYDPSWHQNLLAQWLSIDKVEIRHNIIHSIFVKHWRR